MIKSDHIGPDLVNVHGMGIVQHIWCKTSPGAHIDFQGYEVSYIAETAVSAIQAEELEMHKATAHIEGLHCLTAPVAKILVHVLFNIIGRVEVLFHNISD